MVLLRSSSNSTISRRSLSATDTKRGVVGGIENVGFSACIQESNTDYCCGFFAYRPHKRCVGSVDCVGACSRCNSVWTVLRALRKRALPRRAVLIESSNVCRGTVRLKRICPRRSVLKFQLLGRTDRVLLKRSRLCLQNST